MSARRSSPVAVFAISLAVGLFALPACDKKKDTDSSDSPSESGGSKGGPARDLTVPLPPPPGPQIPVANAKTRRASQDNLKYLAVSFHNFESTYGAFPLGIADSTGKIGLSWRVALLPYVEQDLLYKQFKLEEPWNSEHNKKLIARMPTIYAPSDVETYGYTYYRSFSGKDAFLSPPTGTLRPGQPVPGLTFASITDGTSNTLMVAEALEPVIWTKPEDLPFVPGKPPKLGGGVFADGFNAAFCDGSVRFLSKNLDQTTLSNLIQINDGKVVNLP